MGKHLIGRVINGKRGRYWGELNDAQFEALSKEIGGAFPKGFFAWHLEDGEDITNSKRVQAIAELPVIQHGYWGGWAESTTEDAIANIREAMKTTEVTL